jgi:hypothetical protein
VWSRRAIRTGPKIELDQLVKLTDETYWKVSGIVPGIMNGHYPDLPCKVYPTACTITNAIYFAKKLSDTTYVVLSKMWRCVQK